MKNILFFMGSGINRLGVLLRWASYLAFLFITSTLLMEGASVLFLDHSYLLRGNLLLAYRKYYLGHDRELVQYQPECAVYSSTLVYTLIPGVCHHQGREFSVDIHVNSKGFRDDETSLVKPDILVLGDSFSMGWGVGDHEIYSELLEKQLGVQVLNAAIPSYGTVRALRLIDFIDISNLKYVILQYTKNDYGENSMYLQHDNVLPIMSKKGYEETVADHLRNTEYFPGKHTIKLVGSIIGNDFSNEASRYRPDSRQDQLKLIDIESDAFLSVILSSRLNLNDVQLLVIEINSYAENDRDFIDMVNYKLGGENPEKFGVASIKGIDLSAFLHEEHYFNLDDHMNASGHAAVAKELGRYLNMD